MTLFMSFHSGLTDSWSTLKEDEVVVRTVGSLEQKVLAMAGEESERLGRPDELRV